MWGIHQKRKCALCHMEVDKFIPLDIYYTNKMVQYGYQAGKPETINEEEYSCPFCYGSDRDRLYALFFNKLLACKKGRIFKNVRLLDIAPSGSIQKFLFREHGEITYDTADLFMEDVDYKVDIQEMPAVDDEKYDLFICSHVLEHVKDDKKALRELYRILKPDGIGILLVPLDLEQDTIDEEFGLTEEENWKRFGQGDHVRKYSKQGFIGRMEEAGFQVNQLGQDFFGKREYKRNAINKEAVLYVVTKNKSADIYETNLCEWFVKNKDFFSNDICSIENAYKNCGNKFNCYIDKAEIADAHAYVWGWFYFEDLDSGQTKFKLLIKNHSNLNQAIAVRGIKTRVRDDIEETFHNAGNGNYKFSGIEADIRDDIICGASELYLLAENRESRAMIRMA